MQFLTAIVANLTFCKVIKGNFYVLSESPSKTVLRNIFTSLTNEKVCSLIYKYVYIFYTLEVIEAIILVSALKCWT